jgi:hypothetical protein
MIKAAISRVARIKRPAIARFIKTLRQNRSRSSAHSQDAKCRPFAQPSKLISKPREADHPQPFPSDHAVRGKCCGTVNAKNFGGRQLTSPLHCKSALLSLGNVASLPTIPIGERDNEILRNSFEIQSLFCDAVRFPRIFVGVGWITRSRCIICFRTRIDARAPLTKSTDLCGACRPFST